MEEAGPSALQKYKTYGTRRYMHATLPYAYAAVRFLHARTLVLTHAYVHIYSRKVLQSTKVPREKKKLV